MLKKKLGEILVEAGLITEEQLEAALTAQKGRNKRLGKVLVELSYANELQIAEALSRQLSLPLVKCGEYTLTKEMLAIVPKEMAEQKIVLPLELKGKKLLLAMADPLDMQTIDKLAFNAGLNVSVAVSAESEILGAIEENYGTGDKVWDLMKEMPQYDGVEFLRGEPPDSPQEINVQSLYQLSEAPPIVKLVSMLLADAVRLRASDVHIEPEDNYVQVRYRIDGDLRNIIQYPKHIQESVISRIKIISNLDITNRRLPQDGRSTLRLTNNVIDLRISTLPSVYGEKIVIRLLDRSTGLIPITQMGIPNSLLKPMIEIFNQPQGMLLVTGPTGSGKTTTLYAFLQHLRTETENIITAEDPVEYKLRGITQVAINEPIGLTFAAVLRSILRQDPDIIMVGEMRDSETAEIAVRAAMTGHLVLSTLHTNNTVSTITRLIDIGMEPFLVTSSVSGIFAQRLLKKICPACLTEVEVPDDIKQEFPPLEKSYKGTGCKECHNSGYKGRTGVFEFLPMNAKIRRLVAKNASEDDVWEAARESGIVTLFEDAWRKVAEGITTVEEVISKIPFSPVFHK